MGAAFDRWLAQPSTLCFLRHMIAPQTRPARAYSIRKKTVKESLIRKHVVDRHICKEGEEYDKEEDARAEQQRSRDSPKDTNATDALTQRSTVSNRREIRRIVPNTVTVRRVGNTVSDRIGRGKSGKTTSDEGGTRQSRKSISNDVGRNREPLLKQVQVAKVRKHFANQMRVARVGKHFANPIRLENSRKHFANPLRARARNRTSTKIAPTKSPIRPIRNTVSEHVKIKTVLKDKIRTSKLDSNHEFSTAPRHEKDKTDADLSQQDAESPHIKLSDITSRNASTQGNQMALHMSLSAGVSIMDGADSVNPFMALKHQCDVNNEKLVGKLPVDEHGQLDNFRLWIEIFLFRHRIDGIVGIWDVWRGMRRRGIDLPVEGSEADKLWTGFIAAGICRRSQSTDLHFKIQEEVIEYARDLRTRKQLTYAGLYAQFVGRWLLVHQDEKALQTHRILRRADLVPPGAVAGLVPFALRRSRTFGEFASLYRENEDRDLYDSCIDRVLQHADDRTALAWHRLFLSQGDGPSSAMFARGDVQRLFDSDKDASLPMKMSRKQRAAKAGETTPLANMRLPPLTRVGMNAVVGDVYGIKPKNLSDSFCAKILATTAFSTEVIINGLVFFGIQTLGPLAVRELVLRASSVIHFGNLVAELKRRGIRPDASVYSRLAMKLPAVDVSASLWKTFVESDQHPDEYGNVALQEQLLTSYLDNSEFNKAHLALITLSIAGAKHHNRGWNRIFQYYLAQRRYRSMLGTMQTIRDQKVPLTATTTGHLYRLLLPQRERGKNYMKGSSTNLFDSLRFCTNAFVYAIEQGCYVPPYVWREVLKRIGMDGRWDELKRIILWMSHWYMESSEGASRRHVPESLASPWRRQHPQGDMIEQVFDSKMVKAIFTWGFRYASTRRMLYLGATEPGMRKGDSDVECWASGLAFLKTLQQRGFPVQPDDVLSAFTVRMWILFGPAWSKRAVNNDARRFNQVSLAHYVRHFDSIWPGLLGNVDPDLLAESPQSHPANLLVQLFGRARSTNKRTDEYADVGSWARALAKYGKDHIHESSEPSWRHRAWEKSPFRVRLVRPEATETAADGQETQMNDSGDVTSNAPERAASYAPFSDEEPSQHARKEDGTAQHYKPFQASPTPPPRHR